MYVVLATVRFTKCANLCNCTTCDYSCGIVMLYIPLFLLIYPNNTMKLQSQSSVIARIYWGRQVWYYQMISKPWL